MENRRRVKVPRHAERAFASRFILYLCDNNLLNDDNAIDKNSARQAFTAFKEQYTVVWSFNALVQSMKYVALKKLKPGTEIYRFRPTPLTKLPQRRHQLDKAISRYLDRRQKNFIVSQNYSFRKIEPEEDLITSKSCKICGVRFTDAASYELHLEDGKHNFVKTVREKRRTKPGEDLEFSVVGKTALNNIVIRKGQQENITLTIRNVSEQIINLLSFQIDPEISKASFNMKYPTQLTPTDFTKCSVTVKDECNGVFYYPITFQAEIGNETKTYVAELVFHVQDDFFDFLQPIAPYVRAQRAVLAESFDEIDSGEPPAFTIQRPEQKIKLKPYPLPDDISFLLNCGLKEVEKMRPHHRVRLQVIRDNLTVENPRNPLTPRNYTTLLELLLFFEEHQMIMDIRDYDQEDQSLNLLKNHMFELNVPGLAEHRPSLILGDAVLVRESRDSKKAYQGYVHQVAVSSVHLKFSRRFESEVYVKGKKFYVSFGFNRYPLRTEHQAIEYVHQLRLAPLLFPLKMSNRPAPRSVSSWFNSDIANNEEQQQAVRYILAKSSYPAPYLIFGPPGTGKTMTVVEAVRQIHKLTTDKILICTPSNNAANEVTKRLRDIPTSEIFRYVAPSLPYNQIPQDIVKYTNFQRGDYYHPDMKTLMKYRIVITTLVTATKLVNGGCPAGHFSYAFIDESGQATETETLIPISGVMAIAGKFVGQIVLAGDPKQLGPIIHSPKAREYGFDVSMLERLMATDVYGRRTDNYNPCYVTKLLKNYRSHKVLIEIPNELFYDKELISAGDEMINVALNWSELPNKKFPLVFYSVKGVDQRESRSPSFFNVQEIQVVCRYLDLLKDTKLNGMKIKASHIGIISPYKKQAEKIRLACNKIGYGTDLTVGTVENFQGQERLIIILSTVRSRVDFLKFDYKFHLGFLKNPKRLNVALTRSKALTIIIGNPDVLQYDASWRRLITYCHDNNSVLGEKFELRTTDEPDISNIVEEPLETVYEDGANFSRGNQ